MTVSNKASSKEYHLVNQPGGQINYKENGPEKSPVCGIYPPAINQPKFVYHRSKIQLRYFEEMYESK